MAFDFPRIFAFLAHTRKNNVGVIAKIHGQAHELLGTRHFFDALDGADADI